MRAKYVGNRADKISVVIKNMEASSSTTLPLGAPVIWKLTSTASTDTYDDGRGVILPSTAGAINYQLLAGINMNQNLAQNLYGEAQTYGYCASTLIKLTSRATSTDSWASVATVASGLLLVPDFTNNMFQTLANVTAESRPNVLLIDTLASIATQASNAGGLSDSRVISAGLFRSFISIM